MRSKKDSVIRERFLIARIYKFSGEDVVEDTPVPIPNTEVKLDIADNSWGMPPVKIGVRQIFYSSLAQLVERPAVNR